MIETSCRTKQVVPYRRIRPTQLMAERRLCSSVWSRVLKPEEASEDVVRSHPLHDLRSRIEPAVGWGGVHASNMFHTPYLLDPPLGRSFGASRRLAAGGDYDTYSKTSSRRPGMILTLGKFFGLSWHWYQGESVKRVAQSTPGTRILPRYHTWIHSPELPDAFVSILFWDKWRT